MNKLAKRIADEMAVLVGEPIRGSFRAVDMQIFKFGPLIRVVNRKGEEHETGKYGIHIQCSWRLTDAVRVLFGKSDLYYPSNESIAVMDFDYDKHESRLDDRQREWFEKQKENPVCVRRVSGELFGGFRIELEGNFTLETFPCDSRRCEENEYWRFMGHRVDDSHFVVTGAGIEGES